MSISCIGVGLGFEDRLLRVVLDGSSSNGMLTCKIELDGNRHSGVKGEEFLFCLIWVLGFLEKEYFSSLKIC